MKLLWKKEQKNQYAAHDLYAPILYFLSGLGVLLLLYMAFDTSVWVDEAYTLGIVKYSVSDLIYVTAQDVHPPLYYLIVKLVLFLMRVKNLYTVVIAARIVSVIPYVLIWILSLTYIRREYGKECGALFSVCIISAPHMIANALEIRMYSWAMFFILLIFLTTVKLIAGNKKDIKQFIFLGIWVLCAFYTHYFACISAAVILLFFFIWIILYNRNQFVPFCIMAVIEAVLYMPWMLIAFRQIKAVSGDYWIEPIDRAALWRYFWYAFRMDENTLGKLCGYVLVALSIFCMVLIIRNYRKGNDIPALMGMAVMPLTVVAGIVASLLIRPVFVERYMLPSLGCFWLGFCCILSAIRKEKRIIAGVSVLFLFMGVWQYTTALTDVKENRVEMHEVRNLYEAMDENDIMLHTSLNTEVPAAVYCPDSRQFLIEETPTLAIDQLVFENVEGIMEAGDTDALQRQENTLWCIAYPNAETMTEEWQEKLQKGTYIGTYSIDWCQFEVYKWN